MNSGPNLSRHALSLAALLVASQLFAAEVSPTTRNPLPASPTRAPSVAEPPTATDVGARQLTNAMTLRELPPLPPDVTELKFTELFRQPVGPHGLEFTDKISGLDGKRVRLLGYMVRQSQPVDRCFLLTPMPLTLHEDEYGFAEDMPATVLHVFTDGSASALTPFTPGLLLLTGTLSIGNRAEPDGRISAARLQLDAPTPEQRKATSESSPAAGQKTDSPDKTARRITGKS